MCILINLLIANEYKHNHFDGKNEKLLQYLVIFRLDGQITRILFLPKGAGKNKILTLLEVKNSYPWEGKKILALAASPRGQEFY